MRSFRQQYEEIAAQLTHAPVVHVGEWQAIRNDDMPQADTIEIEDVTVEVEIPETMETWIVASFPNIPWAEDHFGERVSGRPLNPPPSSSWWPYAQQNNDQFKSAQKFSHTYPERMWPRFAVSTSTMMGIRYRYGDLEDVVQLLKRSPHTRQAFLPIWFPEDTGAVSNQRVPCTLGYHFLLREGRLKIVYYIRSCDFFRHFNDDVYMAGRLCQWMATQLKVEPGRLVMHISSLHIFAAERARVAAINAIKTGS